MNRHTYIAGGIALAIANTLLFGVCKPEEITLISVGNFISYLLGAGTGAIIPDIDTRKSTISSQNKISSFFTRLFLTHRGFTHSLLALFLLTLITYLIGTLIPYKLGTSYSLGLTTGYISHLILDAINPREKERND